MKLVWRFCFILFFILFIFALTPSLFAQVSEQNSLETTAIRSPQSPPVVEDTAFVVATATPKSQPAEDNDNAAGGLTIDANSEQITVSAGTDLVLPLCFLIFALFLMRFYIHIENRRRKREVEGTKVVDPPKTKPGEPPCIICGGAHDYKICPTRRPEPGGGPGPTIPVGPDIDIIDEEKDDPSSPLRGLGSQTGSSGDESIKRPWRTGSPPTEPAGPSDSDIGKGYGSTFPNVGPSVTYKISDGNDKRYANGSGALLVRDNLSTRQIILDYDSTISTPHAVIRVESPRKITIRDLHSANGTIVNHEKLPIGQAIALEHNDKIRFGTNSEYRIDLKKHKLCPVDRGLPEIDLSQNSLWLITQQHLSKMVCFKDQQLSSPHLLIRPGDPGRPLSFKLRDLGSSNGTYIKGHDGRSYDVRQIADGTFIAEEEVKIQIGRSGRHYTIEAQPAKMALKSGDRIGERYVVEKQIEQTGMSELYLVRDNESKSYYGESLVAKIPYTQRYGENKVVSALKREIELMTNENLKHKNLLYAKDSQPDASADQNYLIMPYINGDDLETLLERFQGQLRLADAKEIVDQLLSALEHLHNNKWIHCDLKPENILLSKEGKVFLIDLGAATRIGESATFHTKFYSAPETDSIQVVCEASDVYSVGKILFELITGRESKHLSSHIQLRKLLETSEYGQNFYPIIEKATNQSPNERYQNVKELRQDLQEAYKKCQTILKQEGPANLSKLVEEL